MTTATKAAILTAGAVLALTALSKAQAGGTLNFIPGNVHSVSFDGVTPIIQFDLVIQNPTGQAFTVRSLVGTITANDYQIGNVSSYVSTYVRPYGNTVYRLSARMNVLGVVNNIINAINGGGVSQTMRLKGWVNVESFTLPVALTYKIG